MSVYPIESIIVRLWKILEASKKFADIGIEVSGLQTNLTQMLSKKDSVVSELTKGIEFLFKNKVEWLSGEAFIDLIQVEVTFNSGKKTRIVADKIMIAVGLEPVCLPNVL